MLKTNLSYTVAVSESHMLGTELRNRAFDWRAHKALSSISSTTGEEEKKKNKLNHWDIYQMPLNY